MAATGDLQGSWSGPLTPQPGNVECGERFPEFCLHTDATTDDDDVLSYYSKASASARSSTISSVSTTFSSVDSYSSPSRRESHAQPHEYNYSSRPRTPSTASPTSRSRRDKKELQAARLQRSARRNPSLSVTGSKDKSPKPRRFQRSSSPAEALAAVEPPHDQGLTRMAFAEQQRWITVQQKTFTKWCVFSATYMVRGC